MKYLKKFLAFIWQLPQVIAGLLFFLLMKLIFWKKVSTYRMHLQKPWDWTSYYLIKLPLKIGVSFGPLIFGSKETLSQQMNHEFGHSKQSLILGWLYLIVVGIPSFSMNILSIILFFFGHKKFAENYYKRWPESWADKLGDVKRS